MKGRPLQHAARLSPIIFVLFFWAQQRAKKGARAGNGYGSETRSASARSLAAAGPQDQHQVLSNSAATSSDRAFVVLWGVDVDLYDSVVAVPKSSFVTLQTATLASVSVPPAGPFARRPQPRFVRPN